MSTRTSSRISATTLATNIHYAIAWEDLYRCEEAAFSDCPYADVLTPIFGSIPLVLDEEQLGNMDKGLRKLAERVHEVACALKDKSDDDAWFSEYLMLLEAARAEVLLSDAWSLPNIQSQLDSTDMSDRLTAEVLGIRDVSPAAAIRLPPSCDAIAKLFKPLTDPAMYTSDAVAARTIPAIVASYSPCTDPHTSAPEFFSTTFATTCQVSQNNTSRDAHFRAIQRYSRMATTALLHQLHAFGISNVPVFGVLLSKPLVAIHVDWLVAVDGGLETNSAFVCPPADGCELEMKQWDLCDKMDAFEVVTILDRLWRYTETTFSSRVAAGILTAQTEILQGEFRRWKGDEGEWHVSGEHGDGSKRDGGVGKTMPSPPSTPGYE